MQAIACRRVGSSRTRVAFFLEAATRRDSRRAFLLLPVVTYVHYTCVADCADAMADAWEDTAGCAQAICLHENLLK